ncbi:MAG: bifunctional diaminohydroxyphosphoribosylaminopyrimidine deaminase/5-amino-6-(5-phosphoribosylamino)uracil reductase RibD [Ruminococcus sp.]|nr:bifunctional diaminohydroxyphosphoribosylaminopyrimidine deaminase/5-amino-6-(5-phosphoribosylamino)uracil reductase RibD [Ruminococcus sp.]
MTDSEYMHEAIKLAEKGMGFVNPNPMVGAVIVKDGRIIGKGWHRQYGGLHAERNAFADCTEDCTGASLYVTLEPCCHHGKTPPCTEAVIEHGIGRVIIGSADPNPLVAGKGVKILREHGIEVTEGVLKEECDSLNEIFMHYITANTPFVTMKYAITMDGKIACYTGESKWITGEAARRQVQLDRLRHSAIMVGVGTVIADDPMLTCRTENGRNPVRIICDTHLRIPEECNIVKTAKEIPTIIAVCDAEPKKAERLAGAGCEILTVGEADGHTDLRQLMKIAVERKIDSILIEGGGELNWSALQAGIVSKVQTYIAPKLFGGAAAKSPLSGQGVPSPDKAFMLTDSRVRRLGEDFLIESRVKNVHGNN